MPKNIIRVISPAQLAKEYPEYEDMADLAKSFVHQIVLCQEGDSQVIRWKENQLVRHLTGAGCAFHTPAEWQGGMINKTYTDGAVDLNGLAIAAFQKKFPLEEYMKFYMGIGYSLCGYAEVFGQREVTEYGLEYLEEPPEDHNFDEEYWETPLEYMRKKYKNRIAL